MKIGFVLDDTLDSSDGVQQYVLTLGEWLERNGHNVHYLVGETKRNDIRNIHSLSKNIKVRFNKNRMSIPLPADKKTIRKLLCELELDVLHVQMPYSPQLAARVINSAPKNVGIVATFHILPYSSVEKIGTKLLATVVKKSAKRIDRLIAVSLPAAEFAELTYGIDPIVIPNPVKLPSFSVKKYMQQSEKIKLLYLGRLVKRKGVMELLKAVKLLEESSKKCDYLLEIAGSGHLIKDVDSFIRSNSLRDKVKMLGFIDESEKMKLLSKADIAIFPSMGGESFGIVLIEAMAAGAGVTIGGNNPGYSSVLGDKQVLFDPKNTREFADLINGLMKSPKLRSNIHAQQQKIVKQFDVEVVGPKILNEYRSVIAKAGH